VTLNKNLAKSGDVRDVQGSRQCLLAAVAFVALIGPSAAMARASANADNARAIEKPDWNLSQSRMAATARSNLVSRPPSNSATAPVDRARSTWVVSSTQPRQARALPISYTSSKPDWTLPTATQKQTARSIVRSDRARVSGSPAQRPYGQTATQLKAKSSSQQSRTGGPIVLTRRASNTRNTSYNDPAETNRSFQLAQSNSAPVRIPGGTDAGRPRQPGQPLGEPPTRPATPQPRRAPIDNTRINIWGRELVVVVPVRESGTNFGTIPLRISIDDVLTVPADQFISLLGDKITPEIRAALVAAGATSNQLRLDQLASTGLTARYNTQNAEIVLSRGVETRPIEDLSISPQDETEYENASKPNRFSAYVTNRAALGYEHVGDVKGFSGVDTNTTLVANMNGLVFETEAVGRFGGDERVAGTRDRFDRTFSRFVFDQQEQNRRWTLGDLSSTRQSGYLNSPQLLGLQVTKRRDIFQANARNLRPTDFDTFTVSEQSTVDVIVNGQVQRRLALDPGRYKLTDFPFVSGSNQVQIVATDRTGRQETTRFDRFFDFNLLAVGEQEYDFSLGVLAQPGVSRTVYNDDIWIGSGQFRRGVNANLTLGGGLQADMNAQIASVDGLFTSKLGSFNFAAATSNDSRSKAGGAARLTFQRQLPRTPERKTGLSAWTLGGEAFTEDFARVGSAAPARNALAWRAFSNVNFDTARNGFGSIGIDASNDRFTGDTRYGVQGSVGFRLNNDFFVNFLTNYQSDNSNRRNFGIGINFSRRLGRDVSASASYDSIQQRYDFGVDRVGTTSVGNSSLSSRVSGDADAASFASNFSTQTNRANFGIDNTSQYSIDRGRFTSSRTSVNTASSIAFAGGQFALGRPISDSFAIVAAHKKLNAGKVDVDRNEDRVLASTGRFGPALLSDIGAYNSRLFSLSSANSSLGTDIGESSFRMQPTYRSGLLMKIGSEYVITGIGRILDTQGTPLGLVSGEAFIEGDPEAKKVAFFTNNRGQFGMIGLKPGRWTATINGDQPMTFTFTVPDTSENLVRLGDLGGTQ